MTEGHKVKFLWRGHSCGGGCPLASIGSHGTAGRQDRKVKLLTEPWSPALREPQAFRQLSPKILECRLSGQSPLSGIMPRVTNQRWPKQHVIETAGNFWGQPWGGCQSWRTPSPKLEGWRGNKGTIWLVQTRSQIRGEWPWVPAHSQPLHPRVLDRGRSTLGWWWNGGWPPADLNTWAFPQRTTEWIHWHAQQLDMSAWWQELKEVPSQDDIQEFSSKVWASFQIPKVRCCTSKVENDYSVLPAPHSLDRDWFLLLQHMRFGSQDYQLTQA